MRRKPGQYKGMTKAEYQRQWYAKNKHKRIRQERQRRSVLETQVTKLFNRAKANAKRRDLEFDLDPSDIVVTEFCPIFPWVKLTTISGQGFVDSNLSLDRKNPSKGYIKGNVHVVCYKANRNKNSSTLEELIALGGWAKNVFDSNN